MRWTKIALFLFLFSMFGGAYSQSFKVDKLRDLDFGTFSVKEGGSITIIPSQNIRTATGDVILIGSSYGYAEYYISTTSREPITIKIDRPRMHLTGLYGGTASLEYGSAYPEFPVIVAGSPAIVRIGGSLHLRAENGNHSGTYNGTGQINFTIQNE